MDKDVPYIVHEGDMARMDRGFCVRLKGNPLVNTSLLLMSL